MPYKRYAPEEIIPKQRAKHLMLSIVMVCSIVSFGAPV